MWSKTRFLASILAAALVVLPASLGAANVVLINGDPAGQGFNDPTPVAPVGGNTGTTLGAQRLIAFQHALNIWSAQLSSPIDIAVFATFEPLPCTAGSGVLGAAGPVSLWRDFTGAQFGGHWYPDALASKLFGADLSTGDPDPLNNAEIQALFNSDLGSANCLAGSPFYLGLDNAHGTAIDLVAVVLHEVGHGLGFATFTDGITGAYFGGFPGIFDRFALDTSTNKTWDVMTDAERVVSAVNARRLVWNGGIVSASVPLVLQLGDPQMNVSAPAGVAGTYLVGTAGFGPPLASPGLSGNLMPVVDQANGAGLACNPLSATNALAVNGNIAVVDRGTCTFVVKVKNAQDAGARAVVVVDNAAGSPPPGLGGADPTITIPAVRITLADGTALKNALRFRSRTRSGVLANLNLNLAVRSGADAAGRALLYSPNPYQDGSSISHWDTSATPNLLMEPAINSDLSHVVAVPRDLTLSQLRDIGW